MGIGLGSVMSGKLSFALTIIGIFAVISGGLFLDRVMKGNWRIVMALGFILTAIFSYLILSPAIHGFLILVVICLVLAGWGIPFMKASVNAFIANTYPPNIVGRMTGFLAGLGIFGSATGVYFGGLIAARTGTFGSAVSMISVTALVGFLLSYFVKPRASRERDEHEPRLSAVGTPGAD
jgi:sugar phosphate permease